MEGTTEANLDDLLDPLANEYDDDWAAGESENGPPDESRRERLRAQVGDDQASDSGSDEVSQEL